MDCIDDLFLELPKHKIPEGTTFVIDVRKIHA